jgi:hypothetical protein
MATPRRPMERSFRAPLLLWTALFAFVLMLAPRSAFAHAVGLSMGTYDVVPQGNAVIVRTDVTFARGELASLIPTLDPDKNGTIELPHVEGGRVYAFDAFTKAVTVQGRGLPCAPVFRSLNLVNEDGVTLGVDYQCVSGDTISVAWDLVDSLGHGHRHIVSVRGSTHTSEDVLFRGHTRLELTWGVDGSPAATSLPRTVGAFMHLGVEHILTGYDHLLFLLVLILVGGRWKSLALVVTAFTLGHSISIAASVLGFVVPNPRWVEPAIALSIAYVGVENFFVKSADRRFILTFPFGLVHGFGFAGALQELPIPRPSIPTALVGFNLGVEVGQLLVLALALPLVLGLRRSEVFRSYGVRVTSGVIATVGLVLAVYRIVTPGV